MLYVPLLVRNTAVFEPCSNFLDGFSLIANRTSRRPHPQVPDSEQPNLLCTEQVPEGKRK